MLLQNGNVTIATYDSFARRSFFSITGRIFLKFVSYLSVLKRTDFFLMHMDETATGQFVKAVFWTDHSVTDNVTDFRRKKKS